MKLNGLFGFPIQLQFRGQGLVSLVVRGRTLQWRPASFIWRRLNFPGNWHRFAVLTIASPSQRRLASHFRLGQSMAEMLAWALKFRLGQDLFLPIVLAVKVA
jgi:hypothetical protein